MFYGPEFKLFDESNMNFSRHAVQPRRMSASLSTVDFADPNWPGRKDTRHVYSM